MFERLPVPSAELAGETDRPAHRQARLARALGAQTRLVVGGVDDPHEREADAIARQVVASLRHGGTEPTGDVVLRDVSVSRIRRRAAIGGAGGPVDADTEAAIEAGRAGGRPLGGEVRRTMERSIGADFGRVRIHEGPTATELNRSMGAAAFTIGSDIFTRDRVDESSVTGQEMLAHELVHVVQQGAAVQPQRLMRAPEGEAAAGLDDDDVILAQGTISGVIEAPVPDEEKGRETGKEDARRVRRPAGRRVAAAAVDREAELTIVPTARLNVRTRQVDIGTDGGARDALTGTVGAVNWTNPGTKTVKPFGSESFTPTVKNVVFTASKKKVDVTFDLDVECEWGVNSGGNIDVPDGSSSVVKLDTYKQIMSDLTPATVEKSWVAPRAIYWSQAICARHEQFHSTDDRDWAKSTGTGIVTKYLTDHPIKIALLERRTDKVIEPKIKKVLADAMSVLQTANTAFYRGGASSYYSYAGEERAFGDGKGPYEQLVADVKKTGDTLEEAEAKKKEEARKKKEEEKAKKKEEAKKPKSGKSKSAKGKSGKTTTPTPDTATPTTGTST